MLAEKVFFVKFGWVSKASTMGKYEKLLTRIVYGKSDAEIAFADLCNLLERLGFTVGIRGSHHMYRKEGVTEKINLQKEG